MLSFALGSLGLRPWEFYEYSFEEYSFACKGYRAASIADWDRTRHIMYAVLKGAGAKKLNSVEDVLGLPGDGENENPNLRNGLRERLKRAHEQYYGRQQT